MGADPRECLDEEPLKLVYLILEPVTDKVVSDVEGGREEADASQENATANVRTENVTTGTASEAQDGNDSDSSESSFGGEHNQGVLVPCGEGVYKRVFS